jgi:hypothetical protein
MVVLISLATGAVLDYSLGAYQGKGTGETSLLSQLVWQPVNWRLADGRPLLLHLRYYCAFAG